MAIEEAARSRVDGPSWFSAYRIYRKKQRGRVFALLVERGFLAIALLSFLFIYLNGLSFWTFWNNPLLMTVWGIWLLEALLLRYEVNKLRARDRERFRYAKI